MPIFEVIAIFEAEGQDDAETVQEAINAAICPFPGSSEHACPRGWMTMMRELDAAEAAEWTESDALNR